MHAATERIAVDFAAVLKVAIVALKLIWDNDGLVHESKMAELSARVGEKKRTNKVQ